jgi:Pilus assembly protein, PilO
MSTFLPSQSHGVRVAFARAHQWLGAHGLFGLLLIVVAAVVLSMAWGRQRAAVPTASADPRAEAIAASVSPRPSQAIVPPALPDVSDVPKILARIERAATASGLGWPRADYRSNPATEDMPASVEVRCALKGSYPNVRRFVTALLQDTPTLTLKEFSLSRADADAAEVDAKIAIVVYLGGGSAATTGVRP